MSPSARLQLQTQQNSADPTSLLLDILPGEIPTRARITPFTPSGVATETHFHASPTSNTLPQLFASLGVRGVIDENLCQIGIGILYLG
jgi:hypothetical protein